MIRTPARCAVLPLAAGLLGGPVYGDLRIHPDNPHYFQETDTGEPVLIASFTNIVPNEANYDDEAGFRETTQSHRMMYVRSWHFTPWAMEQAIWPWADSATGGGYWGGLGGNKLDMNVWNPTAWARHRDSIARAEGAGVYVQVMLFDRVGLSPASDSRWGNNPWAHTNNVNNLEVPDAQPPNDGTPDFYLYAGKPNLRHQQERYVRKMIDETIEYGNVIYEIENEHWENVDPAFGDYYGQFVKDYIAANYPGSPRLTSYNSLDDDLEDFYALASIDIVNKHYGAAAETAGVINDYIEVRWHYDKPINIDEFANGLADYDVLRRMCWEIVTSGGHFHIEDAAPAARPFEVVENIRAFRTLADWDFVAAAPNRALIVSGGGFCLAAIGQEYVCYFGSGGNKTLNLAAGAYRVQWWNPRTGGFYNVSQLVHGGGNQVFATPDGNDWVLHLTNRPAADTTLDARLAAGITIDGDPGDWNLPAFAAPIFAGDAGRGDTAIIGYGGFESWTCYKGGHWTGGQFPPDGPADHAVRAYARYDDDFLYLLFRVDDSDIRTPNGTASNWANDNVAVYLDPGNDGRASPLTGSTSDLQLVIDAANQRNVYVTTGSYAAQVLGGVTSAVSTDPTGWWLEVRIDKTALDPAIPASGTIGVDFTARDNDANSDALTTVYSWRDPEVSGGFPSKIPDRWGELSMSFFYPGDFDEDDDVDLEDFGRFQVCLSGGGVLVQAGCEHADLDVDRDVDQDDLDVFLGCMAGADQPPACQGSP